MRGNAQKIRQTHATPRQTPLYMNTQQQKCSHSHLGSPRTETSPECNTRPPTFGYGHEKRHGNVKKPRALCTRKRSCAIVRGSAERWQSGRLYLTRNQALGNQPRVRIPPSPPERHKALRGLLFFQRSCNALTALALPRSPPWEQSRGQTRDYLERNYMELGVHHAPPPIAFATAMGKLPAGLSRKNRAAHQGKT